MRDFDRLRGLRVGRLLQRKEQRVEALRAVLALRPRRSSGLLLCIGRNAALPLLRLGERRGIERRPQSDRSQGHREEDSTRRHAPEV